jgi:carbamoyl-phosphate synthase small subunit
MIAAVLVLEDGRTFAGQAYGAIGEAFGEAVFTTGMTGYQETLTDPSYHGQVVVQTSPHTSNWRAQRTLDELLVADGIVGISGVDTRALTRHLRERGAMRVGLFSGEHASRPIDQLLQRVLASPEMAGSDHIADVTTPEAYVVPAIGETLFRVAALDLGIKANTPRSMASRGIETTVLPAGVSATELLRVGVDGVFFSNGPGDPATADHAVALAKAALAAGRPFFGICFGHQILGRALGFGTFKLKYGHRGLNVPVMDRTTGKVEITAQNHGFAVDAPLDRISDTPFGRVEVSHVCLNDQVVEGLRCLDIPAFSVQYHPEAAAGPHDAAHLFDRFVTEMETARASA